MAKQSKIYSYPSGGSSGGTAEAGTSLRVVISSEDWTYENDSWFYVIDDTMFHTNGYLYCMEPFDFLTIEHFGGYEIYGEVFQEGKIGIVVFDPGEQWSPSAAEFLITPSKVKGLEEFESVVTFNKFSYISQSIVDGEGTFHSYEDLGTEVVISDSAQNTPEDIIWNNGSGDVTGTLSPSDSKKGSFYLIPTSTTGEAVEGEYQRALTGNYIVYINYYDGSSYSWIRITPTKTDTLHTHTISKTTASITGTNGTVTASHVSTAGSNGTAATFSASVDGNGVLSFSFSPNTPTTLPIFTEVTAAQVASVPVTVVTDVAIDNQLNIPSYNGEISDNPGE